MKCAKCNEEFNKQELVKARDAKGKRAVSKSAKNYCVSCEQLVYDRAVIEDVFDQRFMELGYYKAKDKGVRGKYISMIKTFLQKLENEGYTMTQVRRILEYMEGNKKITLDEHTLLLIPYNFVEVSKYHNELYRIATNKSYGYIPPTDEEVVVKPPHRPNKKAIKVTNIELI